VSKLRLIWFAKDEQGLKAAYCEVQRHKTGRSARLAGTVERLAGPAADLNDDPVWRWRAVRFFVIVPAPVSMCKVRRPHPAGPHAARSRIFLIVMLTTGGCGGPHLDSAALVGDAGAGRRTACR
jgi:hypothetical protein